MPVPTGAIHDVVIAGAGPVGLFLACELLAAGCTVLLLERDDDARSGLKQLPLGLRGLNQATQQLLDRRGLLDAVRERAAGREPRGIAHWHGQARQAAGHFAGIPFHRDRLAEPNETLAVAITDVEELLAARAIACGAAIRRGCGVDALAASDDGVVVHAGGEMVRARWLIGCDGGRSTVRKAAGIGFTGTDPEFTGYSALVRLDPPAALAPGRHHTTAGMVTYAAPGTIAMVDFDGGAGHRAAPLDRLRIEAILRRLSGLDLRVAALDLATTWTDRAFLAEDYRKGRVLLAGDAAHVHSPLGGQGLNLGLGDAMNLGWKLARVIHGDASADLLDSYARERRPVAARVLDWSRAQVALMRPDAGTRALRAVVADLLDTGGGATYAATRVAAADVRYDLHGLHPLIGRSAPDLGFVDGSRLNERLRRGRTLLLDLAPDARLRAVVDRLPAHVDHLALAACGTSGLAAALVRPDGVVAWASDTPADPAGLEEALLAM